MRPLIKILVAFAVLAAVAVLFVRSVQDTRAEPYIVEQGQLQGWTVTLESASTPTAPMLLLRASPELASSLFRQVFSRMAESLNAPAVPGVPLVLQDEFERAFAGRVTHEVLAEAARQAGLESSALEPRCMAHKRESAPGVTRQLYMVLFESPAFTRFREHIATLVSPDGAAVFDPAALSPVLFVGASEPAFNRWLPQRVDPERDCIAAISIVRGQ
ncbi:MAG: hypothetical protein ACRD1H_08935 [Vicinamibacterales bacterium]